MQKYYRVLRGQFFCGIPSGGGIATKDLMALYATPEAAQTYIERFTSDQNAYHIEAVTVKKVTHKGSHEKHTKV